MADEAAAAEVEEEQSVLLSQDEINAGLSELARSVDGTSVVRSLLSLTALVEEPGGHGTPGVIFPKPWATCL